MHQSYLLFITLIASFFLVRPAVSQTDDGNKIHFDLEKTRAVLSELIEKKLLESGAPSISIALVRGDSIVWKGAFGYSNVRTRTLAHPDTLYNAGSTFKTVTATGIMKLVEEGKFKLEDPVNRYLGDYPVRDRIQSDKPVNFIHILSHWSGLTSWPDRGEATMKSVWGRELPNSLEQVASELYSIRAPETKFEYNNYGYGLAGLLLERVSGVKYEQYISEQILRPLGITTPHPVFPTPDMVEMMAIPYHSAKNGASPRPAPQVLTDVYPAGGTAYLTAEDILNITREGALLYLQKNNRPKKGELFAETKSMFFLDGDSSTISFEVGPDGEVERIVITSSDWLINVAKRRK